MLPGEDGVALLQSLRREPRTKQLPIILVTAKGTEMDKVRGLDAGADDYLSKPFGVMELLARVKALLRRSLEEKAITVLSVGNLTLDRERHLVIADEKPVELTHMEFELLSFLMIHAGRAVTRDMLLDDVWGLNYAGDTRTVDVHIRSLRLKLDACGEMIHTVRGVG
jgi:two-component system alkaline phosphatase synthesis response regulator PhoP